MVQAVLEVHNIWTQVAP